MIPAPSRAASASSIRFAPSGEQPQRFADVPFPGDLYRDAQGGIAIGALPEPRSDGPLFAAIREELARRPGFCASCNVTFGVDGALDPGTLPASAEPGTSASIDDAIALVDINESSPARGQAVPLRLQYDAQDSRQSRWAEPLVPPLQGREAVDIDNPTDAVHQQIAAFFRTFRDEGRATVDP